MKVQGFGRQDRIKVALTRQDVKRLWKMAQRLPEASSDGIVEIRLIPEHDYAWKSRNLRRTCRST